MKLALVHKSYGLDGGTERFAESLARRLAQRGHEVEVYCARVDPRFARTRTARFHKLVGGGGFWGALVLLISAALRIRREQHDVVMHLGRTGPGRLYRAGGGCHRTWWELLLQRAATGGQRFRLTASPYHRLRLWHERRALRRSVFVVPSQRARQDLIEAYGSEANDVVVVPNGVDLDRFHPKGRQLFFAEVRQSLGLPPEELVLLFVGSDFWRKGLDVVLKAVAKLGDEAGELRVLVLGDDPARPEFEALAAQLDLRSRVTFLRSHDRVETIYAACDLMALPTRHDPFANVTLEALASGLPTITSSSNGAIEVLDRGPGLVVVDDPNDVDAVAQAMVSLLDPARLHERQASARGLAEACGEGAAVIAWEDLLAGVAEDARG